MKDTSSNRIKYAMELKQKSQADIVKNTGISKGAISSYLSGRYIPKQTNIYKIAKFLNVDPAWLMGFDVPMEKENNDKTKYSLSLKKKSASNEKSNNNEKYILKKEKNFNSLKKELINYYNGVENIPPEILKILEKNQGSET